MAKQNDDKTESAKSEERLEWILLSQHISYVFCKESGQLSKHEFLFWIPWETQNCVWNLSEDAIIWERGKKDSLSRDKHYDPVFLLMCNCFLNDKVFPQNGRYHSADQASFQFQM